MTSLRTTPCLARPTLTDALLPQQPQRRIPSPVSSLTKMFLPPPQSPRHSRPKWPQYVSSDSPTHSPCSYPPVQFANRTQSSFPALESTTDAFARASLNPDNTASPHPSLISAHSFPAQRPRPGGLAARRTKPPFTLKDIDPNIVPTPSGGAIGAGLGAGRPSLAHEHPRRPNPASFTSPFSNFSKIV